MIKKYVNKIEKNPFLSRQFTEYVCVVVVFILALVWMMVSNCLLGV